MKLVFKVNQIMDVTSGKILVQLTGKYGHIALDLPKGHVLTHGVEAILEVPEEAYLIEIDETSQSSVPTHPPGQNPWKAPEE